LDGRGKIVLIAVVSDTHRDSYAIEKVLKKVGNADVLIHLGDNVEDAYEISKHFKGRTLFVRGNCDFGAAAKSEAVEILEGKTIFITHGHRYEVKYGLNSINFKAQEVGADIVLFGHTHRSLLEFEGGIWFINPGSASEARDKSESIAFIKIDERGISPSIENL
jgi:putative phosphoesterase